MTDKDVLSKIRDSLKDEDLTDEQKLDFYRKLSLTNQSTCATELKRHPSIDGMSQRSKASYTTAQTSTAFSIFEAGTPTTFKKAGGLQPKEDFPESLQEPLIQAFYEEPRTFLNIDDEEEVRRSKERALAIQKELEKLQTKVSIDPNRISDSLEKAGYINCSANSEDGTRHMHKISETDETEKSSASPMITQRGSIIDLEMMDVGTQVYTLPKRSMQQRRLRRPLLVGMETCDFEGCNSKASGGKCEFSVCFVKGCKRNLCRRHSARSANPEEDMLAGKVCVECEPRANKAFYMAVGLFFLVALLIALPGMLIYGSDSTSVPPSLE